MADWLSRGGSAAGHENAVSSVKRRAYQPTPWFAAGWKHAGARGQKDLERHISGGPGSQDRAEVECLNAALAYLQGDAFASEKRAAAALAIRPGFVEACIQRARALRMQGNHRAAVEDFSRANELVPDDAFTLTEEAQEHLALDERVDAFDCLQLAVAHAPDCAPALLGLARMLRESGDLRAALENIIRATHAAPHDAEIHFESALLHGRCGDVSGAVAAYEQGLQLEPGNFSACANLGLMYLGRLGDPLSAQRCFERALALEPSSIEVQANLGLALDEQGRPDAALAHYEKLLAKHPEVNEYRWNRGLVLLANGEYGRGWDDYEMRNARRGTAERAFPFPAWQGETLPADSALLVFAEQGLGDEVMFASCLPDLATRRIDCIVECDLRLAGLFARSFPTARIHGAPRDGERRWLAQYPEIKSRCGIGSLPRVLRRTVADFPSHQGYLIADPERVARWRTRLARDVAGCAVGISWRGGGLRTREDLRSVPADQISSLFGLRGATFVNLQRDAKDTLEQIKVKCDARVLDYGDALADIEEMAALLKALDYVVTVDNSVAHLAGALGCSTWILLANSPDWRWRRAGAECPWYPFASLVRQRSPGDWAGVLAAVAEAVAQSINDPC
jgi:tetratricopeptide (TPR) repeat protein